VTRDDSQSRLKQGLYVPELVGFTERKHDIFELDHGTLRSVVHEFEGTLVIGLSKTMFVREPVLCDDD
jgi:hypothetical protein